MPGFFDLANRIGGLGGDAGGGGGWGALMSQLPRQRMGTQEGQNAVSLGGADIGGLGAGGGGGFNLRTLASAAPGAMQMQQPNPRANRRRGRGRRGNTGQAGGNADNPPVTVPPNPRPGIDPGAGGGNIGPATGGGADAGFLGPMVNRRIGMF